MSFGKLEGNSGGLQGCCEVMDGRKLEGPNPTSQIPGLYW